MAQITAIVDKLLTNVSSAFIPDGYVSEILLPRITSTQNTGKLGKYGTNHLRIEATIMGGRGKARRIESITRTTDTYEIQKHGLEGLVTEDDRVNVEKPFEAERDETIGLNTLLWLKKEKGLADALTDTSVITQNVTLSGASQYNDYSNSDPLGDFKTARQTVYDATGKVPDTAVMDWNTFNCLAYHPGILQALGFTDNRAGQLSEAELGKAMGVKRLLVAMAQFDSAVEGQSESRSNVWGKNIVFTVTPPQPRVYQTSLGYYMVRKDIKPRQVTKFAINNPPRSTGIIVEDAYDMFLSNTKGGFLIKATVA